MSKSGLFFITGGLECLGKLISSGLFRLFTAGVYIFRVMMDVLFCAVER